MDGASLRNPRVNALGRLLASDSEQTLAPLVNQAACGSESDCGRLLYLLTSDLLLRQQSWMVSGFWQPERVKLVDELNAGIIPTAVSAPLLAQAVQSNLERALFATPAARLWSQRWVSCSISADNSYDCPLNLPSDNGWEIQRFVVPAGRTRDAQLIVHQPQSGQSAAIVPPVLRLAMSEGLFEVAYDSPPNTIGVLLDTVKHRAFLGTPEMLRSLVARLVLLNGHYDADNFTPVVTASTVDDHRVSA